MALWEFSNDSRAGTTPRLTFGNPVITKRADGKWVVVFASGYNNVGAATATAACSCSTRSPAQLVDGRPPAVAGGDTDDAERARQDQRLGRFAHRQHRAGVSTAATCSATCGDSTSTTWWRPTRRRCSWPSMQAGGEPQPITTQPELAEVDYPGARTPSSTWLPANTSGHRPQQHGPQSVYAFKDTMADAPLGDVRCGARQWWRQTS